MNILGSTDIWVLFSFLIFFAIAWRFGKSAILGKIDSRIDEIRKEINTAESLRIEAQELLARYRRKQKDAAEEAEKITATAREHANKIVEEAKAEMKNTAKRREQQLTERLKRMEESALAEIQAHAAVLAVQATRELIAENMDKAANEKLLDQSLERMAGK